MRAPKIKIFQRKPAKAKKPAASSSKPAASSSKPAGKFTTTKRGRLIASDIIKKTKGGRISLKKSSTMKKTNRKFLELKETLLYNKNARVELLSKGITLRNLKSMGFELSEVYNHYPLNELVSVYGEKQVIGNKFTSDIIDAKGIKDASTHISVSGMDSYLKWNRKVLDGKRLDRLVDTYGATKVAKGYKGGIKSIISDFSVGIAIKHFGSAAITAAGGIKNVTQKNSLSSLTSNLNARQKSLFLRKYGPELYSAYGSEVVREFNLSQKELGQIIAKAKKK